MEQKNKTAILASMLAIAVAEQEKKDFYEYKNPYGAGLNGITYTEYGSKSYKKNTIN